MLLLPGLAQLCVHVFIIFPQITATPIQRYLDASHKSTIYIWFYRSSY